MKNDFRKVQLDKDLERWPRATRNLFLSGHSEGARVYGAYRDYVMRGEFDHIDSFVDLEKVAVDVGTNIGQYALKLSTMSKACLCIEPLKAFSYLSRVLPDNCIFRNLAAGKASGTTMLRIPKREGVIQYGLSTMASDNTLSGYDCEEQETEVRTIDDLVEEVFPKDEVGFIKIDVEGLEDEVLEGCVATLKKHRPNLQVELHGNAGIEAVCRFLGELDYRGLFFFKGLIFDASQFEPSVHRAPENEWGNRKSKGIEFELDLYACDFFFIPVQ